MEVTFFVANASVLPFWALLLIAPRWHVTERVIRSPLIALPPAMIYAVMIVPGLPDLFPMFVSPRLDAIGQLLGTAGGTVVAWCHFLAFDLLVGRWVYLDMRAKNTNSWIMRPILFLCLMVGPLGYLGYLLSQLLRPSPTVAGEQKEAA